MYADITANGAFFNVNRTTVNIIDKNNNTILTTTDMTKIGTGQYAVNFTPNQSGTYYEYFTYYNSTGMFGQSSDSLTVVDNIPIATTEAFDMILSTFLLFAIGLAFLAVGYYTKIDELWLFSGIWFIANTALLIVNTGLGSLLSSSSMLFALVGVMIIYYYIDLKIKYWFERRDRNRDIEYE